MSGYSWYPTPAVQLEHTFSHAAGTVLLHDKDKQPVREVALAQAKSWQTVQHLIQDLPDNAILSSIPLYLPAAKSAILTYPTGTIEAIVDVLQYEQYLDWLRMANYLNDPTQLKLIAQALAQCIQAYPSVFLLGRVQWSPDIAPELSALIASHFPYNDVDVWLESEPEELDIFNADAGREISEAFIRDKYLSLYYLTSPHQDDLWITGLDRNQHITEGLIMANPALAEHIWDHYFPQIVTNAPNDGRITWKLVVFFYEQFHLTRPKDNKTVFSLVSLYPNVVIDSFPWRQLIDSKIADPVWLAQHHPQFDNELLSQSELLTEEMLSQNLHQRWYWHLLSLNPAFSAAFIKRTYGQPGYNWQNYQLMCNPRIDIQWLLSVSQIKLLDMFVLSSITYCQGLSWQLIKDELQKDHKDTNKIRQTIIRIISLPWIYQADFEDMSRFADFDQLKHFIRYVAMHLVHNPNLSSQFIMTYHKYFIEFTEIFKHPHFTPEVWQYYREHYASLPLYNELIENPNFGVQFLVDNYKEYSRGESNVLPCVARKFDSVEGYLQFVRNLKVL